MMIEKSGTIRLRDIPTAAGLSPKEQELAAGMVRVPAFEVDVVDTVGAGDAFMAGLIDGLWTRELLGARRRRDLARIDIEALTAVMRTAATSSALTV